MSLADQELDHMVTALVPSMSRSLADQFNVFRVMRHGTHEKQLSNVFAWLLSAEGSHELGARFQQAFVEQVNLQLPTDAQMPPDGYTVIQEVDTSGQDGSGKDIADIVLSRPEAAIVVENFVASDGHGHNFHKYLAHGASGGRTSVVVLLCALRQPHRQADGWERAIVVTYAELLEALRSLVAADARWARSHPDQIFFINHMYSHFVEGSLAMSYEDRIAFMKAMCETGESARYGYRPQDHAADEFAELLAQHGRRQFEDGRALLAEVKQSLKSYVKRTLAEQLNSAIAAAPVTAVQARFVGKWEWCVAFRRRDGNPSLYLNFGPTAAYGNTTAPKPIANPDFSKVFVSRQAPGGDAVDRIAQTGVGLDEVLAGLADDDLRLRDALLGVL